MNLLCWLRGHQVSASEWGYGFGELDLFCSRCGRLYVTIAIDRHPYRDALAGEQP